MCVCFHVSACVFIRHSSEAISRDTSSTRTRRGGSCLKDIYRSFLIYRTCMRRAPAKPVRACTLRKCCLVSHVTFEAPLHTSHLTVHTSHCTLHTALFALHSPHSSHFTLHPSQPQPHPPHRRSTFHRRLQPLYTEKRKVSCSSFLPTT